MVKPMKDSTTLEGETYVVKGKDKTRLMQIVRQSENRSANEG